MATSIKVVLFEDVKEVRAQILQALEKYLKPEGEAIPFEGRQFKESKADKKRMYEDRLQNILTKEPYDRATLLVVDRDLSKSQESDFRGLSVGAVLSASKRLAIPVCSYAREPEQDDYEWRRRWEEGHIILSLSDGEDELARRAVLAASGFAEIAMKLPKIDIRRDKPDSSPAKILAALLGKPEYSDKITLYSVGDKYRLTGIPRKDRDAKQFEKRTALFLGHWLWDSLLRYPGVLVNEVATGSYLNISTDDFRDPKVQDLVKEALYRGPFADPKKPQWWRGMLDDIVSGANCGDGLALVQEKLGQNVKPSQCYVDPSKSAGYYCIISRQPVSLENSKGGLSWFPRGADLTRIGKRMFDEYGPWLGA